LLITVALANIIAPALTADTILKTDFQLESFAKTIDFYDYARAYATLNGIATPPGFENWRAYMYTTYVNTKGLQMLYAGLCNVSFGGTGTLTIPMQTFMMHYRTDNKSRDVLTAQTFLMLLAFNETGDSIYANSPDMNDTLWASFTMGFNLGALNATLPVLNSKTQLFPLTHTDDNLQWSWGMKYTNLTALWWRTWINPLNPHFEGSWPVAVTVYDELTFTYNLTINPTAKTATLTENHIIGRMRHLIIGLLPILWVHYNSTGTYGMLGNKIGNDTIYDFIDDNQIKMSVANFQTSILADHETYTQSADGQNVTDTEKTVSNSGIKTYADDGEKILDASFGTKQAYKLYNYTADQNETSYNTYDSTARTCKINGFANNAGLFQHHMNIMKFLPLLVANMYPALYARAKETITNMTRANYFYVIGYPTYSGYRIEHDPTITVYLDTTATFNNPPNLGGLIVIGAIAAIVIAAVAIVISRRKPKQSLQPPAPPTVNPPAS